MYNSVYKSVEMEGSSVFHVDSWQSHLVTICDKQCGSRFYLKEGNGDVLGGRFSNSLVPACLKSVLI